MHHMLHFIKSISFPSLSYQVNVLKYSMLKFLYIVKSNKFYDEELIFYDNSAFPFDNVVKIYIYYMRKEGKMSLIYILFMFYAKLIYF